MRHWKTNEEMGSGWVYSREYHKEHFYNIIKKYYPHETTTMRTKYLIRDFWTIKQLEELKEYLDEQIEERKITS